MALKTLMLRKNINDMKKTLDDLRSADESFLVRESDLEQSIAEVSTQEERDAVSEAIDAFDAEKKEHEGKKAELERQVADLEKELAELEAEQKETPQKEEVIEENREVKNTMEIRESKEYLHAWADMVRGSLRDGKADEAELRALLTENSEVTGEGITKLPLPTYVEGRIRTAWERNGLMDLIRKTYAKGNLKIGYEIDATGAVKHSEGAPAIDEEILTVGVKTLVASNYKKFIRVSDELLDSEDYDFIDYVYDEIAYQIAKAVADDLLAQIIASPATSSATEPAVPVVQSAPALDTVAQALGELSEEADNPVIVMNRKSYPALRALQLGANYAVDPFEGLEIRYNNSLDAYADASAGDTWMIVGDFGHGAHANFPAGADIKFKLDDLTEATADMNKIIGRQYVGVGVVAPNAFVKVVK